MVIHEELPSLTRIRASKRISIGSRLLVVWLSLSLVLTLTPCCEVFADAVAPLATDIAHAMSAHGHDEPDNAFHSSGSGGFHDPCAKWLDHADYTLSSLHAAITSAASQDIFIGPQLPAAFHAVSLATKRFLYHPPPDPTLALYLRFEHLLL